MVEEEMLLLSGYGGDSIYTWLIMAVILQSLGEHLENEVDTS